MKRRFPQTHYSISILLSRLWGCCCILFIYFYYFCFFLFFFLFFFVFFFAIKIIKNFLCEIRHCAPLHLYACACVNKYKIFPFYHFDLWVLFVVAFFSRLFFSSVLRICWQFPTHCSEVCIITAATTIANTTQYVHAATLFSHNNYTNYTNTTKQLDVHA